MRPLSVPIKQMLTQNVMSVVTSRKGLLQYRESAIANTDLRMAPASLLLPSK